MSGIIIEISILILVRFHQGNEIFCHPDDILGNIRIFFLSKIKIFAKKIYKYFNFFIYLLHIRRRRNSTRDA